MTFENFSRLTGTKLLNEPSISSFENIETNPKKIKRGDLFIGNDIEDIELALSLEAYGIVSTTKHKIIDNEIAWFIANSLNEVLIKILRFKLMNTKFHFIYLHPIEIELIKTISSKENMVFLDTDENERYKKIINADAQSIIFSSDKEFLNQIYPEFKSLRPLKKTIFKRDNRSLFLSNFIYRGEIFTDIKIPPLLLEYLENVVTFLEQTHISYEIEKCTYNSQFYPIFVNQKLQIKPFGRSERVVITILDNILMDKTLTYIKAKAPWAKTICIIPSELDSLKNIEFNFAIIVIENERLVKIFEKNESKEQNLLF